MVAVISVILGHPVHYGFLEISKRTHISAARAYPAVEAPANVVPVRMVSHVLEEMVRICTSLHIALMYGNDD